MFFKLGNLPVNWPKLLGPFKNSFTTCFRCVRNAILHHFRDKEVRYYFFNCDLDQFNAVE